MNLEMGEVDGWIPDWFPKVEKEESRKWEPVDGILNLHMMADKSSFIFPTVCHQVKVKTLCPIHTSKERNAGNGARVCNLSSLSSSS